MEFTTIICMTCKMPFGVLEASRLRYQQNGDVFYCPNGHRNSYGEIEAEKLKKALAIATESKEYYCNRYKGSQEYIKASQRQLAAAKGRITKLKKKYEPAQGLPAGGER